VLFFRAVGDIPNLGVTALEAGAGAVEAGAASGFDACSTSPLRASAGMQRFKAFVQQALRCAATAGRIKSPTLRSRHSDWGVAADSLDLGGGGGALDAVFGRDVNIEYAGQCANDPAHRPTPLPSVADSVVVGGNDFPHLGASILTHVMGGRGQFWCMGPSGCDGACASAAAVPLCMMPPLTSPSTPL